MMSDRQKKILSAIVEQYAELAAPVGSRLLAQAFDVSPATMRAEMAKLEDMGYLEQPHTSAGRIPTDKGYRYYVNNVVNASEDRKPSKADERYTEAMRLRVSSGGRADMAIRAAVNSLVEMTHNLAFATIGEQLYISGISYLFAQPEFMDGEHVRQVAKLLDNLEPWLKEASPNEPLNVYIGSENPIGRDSGASLIISKFRSPYSDKSYVGTLGPTRQSYAHVMTLVAQTGRILEQLINNNLLEE